jgi:autotransporter-associated beta strand protein
LEQAGSGTLTVLGANTNSGGTIVTAGTLRVGNGGTTGSLGNGNISMASGATLAYDRSDAVTLGNTLSGAGNLRHSGSGTLAITANNTHSGGTVIDSGRTLQVGAGSTTGSLGSGAVTNNGTLVYNRSGSSTFANNISGTGSLDIATTANSPTLSGNNSFTGTTRVRGTEITIGSNALAGSTLTTFSEDNVANLQLRGTRNVNAYNIGGLSGNRNITFDSNFVLTSVGSNNQNTTFSGSINAGQLSKVGTGTLELSGASNNFTGEFRIHSGKVEITGGNTTVVNWGISVGSLNGDNASFEIKDGRYTGNISLGQNLGSAGTMSMNGGTVTGAISVGHGSGSTGSFVMSGGTHILTNGNGLNVGVRGEGTYTLTNGTVNGTFFGPNTASAARVAFDRGSIGTMNVSGGDISVLNFSLGRGVDSIGTLNLTGGRIVSAFGSIGTGQNSNSTINISGGSFETTSSSDLWFGGSSHRSRNIVNLTGSGSLSAAGSIAYYDTSPDSSLTFNIGTGGEAGTLTALKIDLNGSNSKLNFNHTNENYNLSSSIVGDPLVVSQIGSGKTILSGSNLAWRGGTVINGGTLQVGNGGSHSSTWAVSNITNNGTLVINSGISSTILGVMSGSGHMVKDGMGTLTLYGDNAFTGNTIINDGTLQTTTWSSGGGPTQFGRLHSSSALTVNTNGSFILGGAQTLGGLSGNGTITLRSHHLTLNAAGDSEFSGGIFGTGGLTKEGSGTFTLSGANNFKGNTLVNDGRLVLSSSSALGGASVVKVNEGGTLEVTQRVVIGFLDLNGGTVIGGDNLVSSLSLINDGTVSGLANGADFAAGILKRTAGLATVDGANTYTGTTKIEAGVVRLVAGGSFAASSSLFLQSGGTMDLNGISQTFSALDGTGGTVALGSGDVTVNGSGNSTFAGDIMGEGRLIKAGGGSLTLSGSNSQSGGYEVTGGRLIGSTSSLNGNIANPIDSALDVSRPRLHSTKAIGYRSFRVVMSMYAEWCRRFFFRHTDYVLNL